MTQLLKEWVGEIEGKQTAERAARQAAVNVAIAQGFGAAWAAIALHEQKDKATQYAGRDPQGYIEGSWQTDISCATGGHADRFFAVPGFTPFRVHAFASLDTKENTPVVRSTHLRFFGEKDVDNPNEGGVKLFLHRQREAWLSKETKERSVTFNAALTTIGGSWYAARHTFEQALKEMNRAVDAVCEPLSDGTPMQWAKDARAKGEHALTEYREERRKFEEREAKATAELEATQRKEVEKATRRAAFVTEMANALKARYAVLNAGWEQLYSAKAELDETPLLLHELEYAVVARALGDDWEEPFIEVRLLIAYVAETEPDQTKNFLAWDARAQDFRRIKFQNIVKITLGETKPFRETPIHGTAPRIRDSRYGISLAYLPVYHNPGSLQELIKSLPTPPGLPDLPEDMVQIYRNPHIQLAEIITEALTEAGLPYDNTLVHGGSDED